MALRQAVFIDRDGVINYNRDTYVKSWDEFCFIPGVLSALKCLATSPYAIVVVSNQSAVGRGLMNLQTLECINAEMRRRIQEQGGRIDRIYYCPHIPEDNCDCRKPRPGMLIKAASELGIDLRGSWMVGDAASDVEAAVNAGCQPLFVLTGKGHAELAKIPKDVPVFQDLIDVVQWLYPCFEI